MPVETQNLEAIWETVEEYAPAAEQPLWRRLLYVVLGTTLLMMMLPDAVVVSDVSHTMIGFEPFPSSSGRARPVENGGNVWVVEESEGSDWYSNGLQIDNSHRVRNTPRFYQLLDRSTGLQASEEWKSEPVGIVFHTTESPQAPFGPDQNDTLRRLGKNLLDHIRDNRSYNFVVDRFGRVFRVVEEGDAAHHAGNSLWADGRWALVNLNASFIGIAFEAQGSSITSAQKNSGRLLVQMLRAKYKIRPELCVTHSQVSVNPSNMRIGYHTDWAEGFPFAEMGLANNYDLTLASITDFGFQYDETFKRAVGEKLWRGLITAEKQVVDDAKDRGRDLEGYRADLQERYHRLYASLKETGNLDEGTRLH